MLEFKELIQTCQFSNVHEKLAAIIRLARYQRRQLTVRRWAGGKSALVIHFESGSNKSRGDMLFAVIPLHGLSFRTMHCPADRLRLITYRDM